MNASTTFLWSVRREIWEHRAIYFAPLAVAGLVLFATLFNLGKVGELAGKLPGLDPDKQTLAVAMPFSIASSVIVATAFFVALFYCLDALYGERRDRSILFWKSMPVSDFTTVASKIFIPVVVMPIVAFVIALATQLVLLALGSAALAATGADASLIWSRLPLGQMTLVMVYGFVVHSLWYAPLYAWLMLVSAWAKKAPFLWAALPVFGAFVVEKIAFGTSYVYDLVTYRIAGAMQEAFVGDTADDPVIQLSQLDPARFFSSAGLWTGLVCAALLLAAAVWLRRRREPI